MKIRTTTIEVYQFNELSEEAQQKALEKLWDINVNFDWWDFMYEDAERIGLKITEFDLDRRFGAKGVFLEYPSQVAKNVMGEHDKECETCKTSERYLSNLAKLALLYLSKNSGDDDYDLEFDREYEGEKEDLDKEYLMELLGDYAIALKKEYEYRTSELAVVESILSNEYEFDIEGNLV